MTRATLVALLLLPLGCTVSALPGSEVNRLGNADGGSTDLGHHDGGGGCGCDCGGGGNVDLAWHGDGGHWDGGWDAGHWDGGGWPVDLSGGGWDGGGWPVDFGGGGWDGATVDAAGGPVDLAH